MTQTETELLPCPFCGSPPDWHFGHDESDIYCPNPECGLAQVHCDITSCGETKPHAIAAWNRRTPPKVSAEGVSEEAVQWAVAAAQSFNDDVSTEGMRAALEQALLYLRPSTPEVGSLTRPIVGIEYRSPQEVFDIMCDRVRGAAK